MDKGTVAEIELANNLIFPMLVDFVQLKPYCLEGKKIRELCDLFIEMDNEVILVELKIQNKGKAKPGRDDKKWAKKKLIEASNQISGAIKSIAENIVWAIHPHRGLIEYPKNCLKPLFGLVIIDYELEPFEIQLELQRRTKQNNIPIHYFSINDFTILCQKLMTLPDLILYLKKRSIIPSWSTPNFNDERNFYAYYLINYNNISYSIQRSDFSNYWEKLETDFIEIYNKKNIDDQKVEIYNEMLNILGSVDPIEIGENKKYSKTIKKIDDPDRVEVTRILNRFCRIHRREFVEKMLEKLEKSEKVEHGYSYFAYAPEEKNVFILFLASKNDREKRKRELDNMTIRLNSIVEANTIVGIATESKNAPAGRSYDFIFMEDVPKDLGEEFKKESEKYFKPFVTETKYDFPRDSELLI